MDYYAIAFITLQQIKNIVFARKIMKPYISCVETDSVPTGIANTLGNKGISIINNNHNPILLSFLQLK